MNYSLFTSFSDNDGFLRGSLDEAVLPGYSIWEL